MSCAGIDPDTLPRLAFVHIPKTAGTSVTRVLQALYGARTFPAMTTLDYQMYDTGGFAPYRFFKGHAYRRDYERLPPDTRLFTILRDPVRRTLSYYNYCRRLDAACITDEYVLEAIHLARTLPVVEFIYAGSPSLLEHVRLGQVRQFLPAERLQQIGHRRYLTRAVCRGVTEDFIVALRRFAYVLTAEALPLSFPRMLERLGLPLAAMKLPHENASPSAGEVDPADIRRALIDVNAAEFDCYDYARLRELDWLANEHEGGAITDVAAPPVAALAAAEIA